MTYNREQKSKSQLYWVSENVIAHNFPPVGSALRDPDGLLAIGGDLSPERLLEAYQKGIFPWYNRGQPIMWWAPDPRCVFELNNISISRSLRKTLRKKQFTVSLNKAFKDVIIACSEPRKDHDETWISEEIITAYLQLHEKGFAHSVECWMENELVGGLYGIAIDRVFFGESMFTRKADASKIALVHLSEFLNRQSFRIIDCQIHSQHLQSLGAKPMPRRMFDNLLKHYCLNTEPHPWPCTELFYYG